MNYGAPAQKHDSSKGISNHLNKPKKCQSSYNSDAHSSSTARTKNQR